MSNKYKFSKKINKTNHKIINHKIINHRIINHRI